MLANTSRWSHTRGNTVVPSRWQATRRDAEVARAAQQATDDAQRSRAVEWSRSHLGEPLADGAATLGLSVARLRHLLGDRAGLHPHRIGSSRLSDEEILRHVSVWVKANNLSGVGYEVAAREHGWPSLSTVVNRFGSWRQALHAADLIPEPAPPGRRQRWTDEELVAVVRAYFAESRRWSGPDLQDWLDADPGRPSLSLVKVRLGGWSALVRLADPAP